MKAIDVAAGLVFRAGQLLVTRRPDHAHLGGLWEFPGGKRHEDETFEACLRRELMEEVGIEVEVGALLESVTHSYPDKRVHLRFFHCTWLRHEPKPIGCAGCQWIGRGDLERFDYPAADRRLLRLLRTRADLWRPPHEGTINPPTP